MDSPERGRSYSKDVEDSSGGLRGDWTGDEEERDPNGKRKHMSSKTRKPSNGDESEGLDGSGRRRSDKSESRRRSSGSSRADSEDEELSKQLKKKQEESSLERLSSWYQDRELENMQDTGEKSGRNRAECSERRRSSYESVHGGSKSKEERSHDGELDKSTDRVSRNSEKGHGSDVGRSSRRRWDECDASSAKNEFSENKSKGLDSIVEKSVRSSNKEERKIDTEKLSSKGWPEGLEEDIRASPVQRTITARDVSEGRERSFSADEDRKSWVGDKSRKEAGQSDMSRLSQRSSRSHQESEHSEMEYEMSTDFKSKEDERDGSKDDRLKARDDSWSDRDREVSKENWQKRQQSVKDKDLKDGQSLDDRGREWGFPRHGRERNENERPHGRPINRKDGSRGEDVIEIQPKAIEGGRTASGSNFARRTEFGQLSDVKSTSNEEERAYMQESKGRRTDIHGSGPSGEEVKEKYMDDDPYARDPSSWKDGVDYQGGKGRGQRDSSGQTSSAGSQLPYGNQDQGSYERTPAQGIKGNRVGRGGNSRPASRDNQQVGVPMPIMGSPFVPLGMAPPGPMQQLTPSMSPAPGVFLPPFSPPIVWPGVRGVDMNILGVPPGLSAVPPGTSVPRFPPNMGTPNPGLYFNPSGPMRVGPSSVFGPGFDASGPMGRGTQADKNPGAWVPPRISAPPGKAPSRGEQNDYSQNFVDTGMRPQNFIRELELTNVEDYPKLRELIQKKDEIVSNSASTPMYQKCDLREFELSPEFFGTKFDVILVDPPWEEYVHRAPGVADNMEYWTFEEILNLKIEAIADTPSFIFLWVGDGVGLEQGRQCLKKWGFRRCEDICWVKTNKTNATPGLRHDTHTLFQHTKEHCLMGIKGTVRRSTDGHIIHANIDTDVIIAEEPPYGSTQKPEDMYRIIEHFALGRRRLELFGEDHNIRSGWLTLGKGLSSSNFKSEDYTRNFADKDGKVWQGGGRNPPPDAPHLVVTTPDIESLRPKSPMKNQQQLQQQHSSSISLTTATSSNRRPTGTSPQNSHVVTLSQEVSSSNLTVPPWAPPMDGFRVPESGSMYGFGVQPNGEYLDFESNRPMNLL